MDRLIGALDAFASDTVGAAIGYYTAPTGLMLVRGAGALSPMAGRVVRMDPAIAARWADVRAPLAVDDLASDPRLSGLPGALATTLGLRSALVVPLVTQNVAVGALVLASANTGTYRSGAIQNIESISAAIIPLMLGSERLGHLLERLLWAGSAGWANPLLSGDSAMGPSSRTGLLEPFALKPVFQPIISVSDRRVVGFEGLSRFIGPSGHASADLFGSARLSLAGHQMELQALEAILLAARRIPDHFILSVNLSPLVALHPAAQKLILAESRALILELTEYHGITPAMEMELGRLRGSGIQLAVDDVGSGHSTLSRILRLRPEVIKLDRDLISDLATDPVRQTFVTAFVQVAAQTGSAVIAEGVETGIQAEILAQLGVDYAQGYAFGRPQPVDDLFTGNPSDCRHG
jgi:EAL domain-containing protein (putative c-di-GMP-specific phosphodiesterase class I)